MLVPARQDMTALNGGSFDVTISLFSDQAQTIPFPLTGYTVVLYVDRVAELTVGNGLTVNASLGQVVATLTPAQTANTRLDSTHYRLQITDGSGNVNFPVSGQLQFTQP